MKVATYEATVEDGQIKLSEPGALPEHARVYIVVPGPEETPRFHVGSPRLARPEQAADFTKRSSRSRKMPAYDDSRFDPPAPVARVCLRQPDGGQSLADVPMLIDSGADATLLPRSAVASLGITSTGEQYQLVGFDGTSSIFGGRSCRCAIPEPTVPRPLPSG